METAMLRTMFDAHVWATHRVLDALSNLTPEQLTQPLTSSFSTILLTAAHTLASEQFLASHALGETIPITRPKEVTSAAALREPWESLLVRVEQYLQAADAPQMQALTTVRFRSGDISVPAWQVIYQLFTHAAYHRGQLTTMIRQVGGQTVSTDAIRFFGELARD